MSDRSIKNRIIKIPALAVGVILILVISAVFLWIGSRDSSQATPPTVANISFCGEYRIADGEWKPIVKGEHISSTKGDVTLRGYFRMHNPTTGSVIGPLAAGSSVSLYFNHVNGTAYLPIGGKLVFDAENPILGEDACGKMWGSYTVCADATGDTSLTIVLHNPHSIGNEGAIDEFLANMSAAPGIYFDGIMLEKGSNERSVGLFIVIAAIIVLGIAAFSSIIRIKYSAETWLVGLMSMFAGGYFIFDAFAVSLWNDSNIINTRALGICIMFYMVFCTSLIVKIIKPRLQRIAAIAPLTSSIAMLCCIAVSFFDSVKFYDTWFYWAAVEICAVILIIACQIMSLKGATVAEKMLHLTGIVTLISFIIDVIASAIGWWEGGLVSKQVFLAVFIIALVIVLRLIPHHINAAIRARELEAERQALKLELQESRISIMLSQMQPHFIFNTLNTIYHLCEIDPDVARSTISSFSEYLRNNIDNLGQSEMISFEKELSFVKTYLDIEKVRFDDELEITYDVETTDFKLPVLTVQPIVENAVKHGTSKKEGISTLLISVKETDGCYEIRISDTGVGFDPNGYQNDGHKHIGISSVRQRLSNLCDGTLTIDSTPGVGTTATISIPKKEAPRI